MERTRLDSDLYHYRAHVCSVYGGDTCTLDIDLGLGTWVHGEKVRLHRIDAPEVRGEGRAAGLRARDFLRATIDGRDVIVETVKDTKGKYGRYLAEIWLGQPDGGYINVNDLLVASGHAVYREY
jgi:micrococcal nuclease